MGVLAWTCSGLVGGSEDFAVGERVGVVEAEDALRVGEGLFV